MKLEDKLFTNLLYFAVFLSVINVVLNLSIGFRFDANYKWFAFFVSAIVTLVYQLRDNHQKILKNLIFAEIVFVFLPNGWLLTQGNSYSSLAYLFLITLLITMVLEGKNRLFYLVSEMIIVTGLLLLEFYNINTGSVVADETLRLDSVLQVPIALFGVIFILVLYTNAYRKEEKQLQEYSRLLENQNKELLEIATTDELTHVYNRRYIFSKLDEIKKHLDLVQYQVRLAIVDIDNFKTINDAFGHLIGDRILKEVSDVMKRTVGDKGYVGRYGGDEFIIILNNISHQEQTLLMECIRAEVSEINTEEGVRVTISGGSSRFYPTDRVDDVINRADQMLYKAKADSKNRMIMDMGKKQI